MVSKLKTLQKHAKRRAAERYGIDYKKRRPFLGEREDEEGQREGTRNG